MLGVTMSLKKISELHWVLQDMPIPRTNLIDKQGKRSALNRKFHNSSHEERGRMVRTMWKASTKTVNTAKEVI